MTTYKIAIRSKEDEPGLDPTKSITLEAFLKLLKEEEDYYDGEQQNTKLMITRTRKIFYDQWGWDKYLIRGAKGTKSRYITKVVGKPDQFSTKVRAFKKGHPVPKHRVVCYSSHDKVYGASRAGQSPPIINNNYQSVRLPNGDYCHVAHILGVLDASNYPQIASPFPSFLLFLAKLGPYCDSNVDLVSWLDDLGQGESEIINLYRRKGSKLTEQETQKCLDDGATGADMIADIDGYIMAKHYDIGSTNGQRLTEILHDYYYSDKPDAPRKKRCTEFASMIGLEGWDGKNFSNESSWIRHNRKQLRNASTFQIFSETAQKISSIWVPLLVWLNFYSKVMQFEEVLKSFIHSLKQEIRLEQNPN